MKKLILFIFFIMLAGCDLDVPVDPPIPPPDVKDCSEVLLAENIEIRQAKKGAQWLVNNLPADIYIYGHFGSYEDTIEDLKAIGKIVYRYVNVFSVSTRAGTWSEASVQRFLYDWASRHNTFLC